MPYPFGVRARDAGTYPLGVFFPDKIILYIFAFAFLLAKLRGLLTQWLEYSAFN